MLVSHNRSAIIHLGTEKTGTSSLQAWLRTNAQALLKHNILYPTWPPPGPHVELTTSFRHFVDEDPLYNLLGITTTREADSFSRNYQLDFSNRLANSQKHDILIISDEHIFGYLNGVDEVSSLFNFFENNEYDIIPIICLRSPESYVLAIISEAIKCLSIGGFDPSNPVLSTSSIDPRLRYDLIIKNISLASKNIKIFAYKEGGDFNVIQEFLAVAGIDTSDLSLTLRPAEEHNKSIPYPMLPFYSAVASYLVNYDIKAIARQWRQIVDRSLVINPISSKLGLDWANRKMLRYWFKDIEENLRNIANEKLDWPQDYKNISEQQDTLPGGAWESFWESIINATPSELMDEMVEAYNYFKDSERLRELAYPESILAIWDSNINANIVILEELIAKE